ncbi:MAG: tetratricopeptide repeat protein [bacterium]|jgi:tetratricopeptide (TPR) repeat protein|nr:MAG: hypothetical protein DIU52_09455 [bacterium]
MTSGPAIADLQRLSEEVARDPGSSSFLPLAEAYRRMGKTQAALRVCLRGLERSPGHVGGHLLLARLYLELGDRERAADEWAVVVRIDPDNFDAHRGLGFFHLERGELSAARRHLERAARIRPGEPTVREALGVLRRRQGHEAPRASGRAGTNASVPAADRAPADGAREAGAATAGNGASPRGSAPPATPGGGGKAGRDPSRVFEPLGAEAPYLGGLLLDSKGLVLAGSFRTDGTERGEMLGAVIGAAAEEAARTAALLSIGSWRGILLETDRALLHVTPLERDLLVLTAAARGTPVGWMLRAAERTAKLAREFLEGEV